MINTIPNNPDYNMPQDSFFKFCFLSHKDRLYTAKANLKCGELTTAFLNISKDKLSQLLELTVQFNMFVDNAMVIKNAKTMTEFMNRIIEFDYIKLHFGIGCSKMTYEEIGEEFCVSAKAVEKAVKAALDIIRKNFNN